MKRFVLAFLLTTLTASPLHAQADLSKGAIAAPDEKNAIPLGTGGVPGMPGEIWFEGPRVRNVSTATLTPFLPEPARATGAAVIVAPGGAFALLAIDKEGWSVARWLADHGIAAFVLKYRLRPTPADPAEAQRQRAAAMASRERRDLSVPPQAVEDGQAALRLVRARASEWGIDPTRIGMMGFSAGAMTTLAVTLQSRPDERPAFVAPIYGPMQAP
jgi:acetyl esterase/lipase